MDQITDHAKLEREPLENAAARPRRRKWRTAAAGGLAGIGLSLVYFAYAHKNGSGAMALPAPAPPVTVSQPLQRDVDARAGFLGQFSAVDRVELRAQVGGTLTEIHFTDGQIVHKGDLLFVIDPRPYE